MQRGGDPIPLEAIVQWLFHEMEYSPSQENQGRSLPPSRTPSSLRYLVRGNLIPVWQFFLAHVRNKKHVFEVKKNLAVHLKGKWLEAASELEDQEDYAAISELEVLSREQREKRSSLRQQVGLNEETGAENSSTSFADGDISKQDTTGELLRIGLKGIKGQQKVLSVHQAVRDQKAQEVEELRQEVKKLEERMSERQQELSKQSANRLAITENAAESRAQVEILRAYDRRCEVLYDVMEVYHEQLIKHAERGVKRSSGTGSQSSEFIVAGIPGMDGPVQMSPSWFSSPGSGEKETELASDMEKRVTSACSAVVDELQSNFNFSVSNDDLFAGPTAVPSTSHEHMERIEASKHGEPQKHANAREFSSLKGRPVIGLDVNKDIMQTNGKEGWTSAIGSKTDTHSGRDLEFQKSIVEIPGDLRGDFELMARQPGEFVRALARVCAGLTRKVRSELEVMDPAKDALYMTKKFEAERRAKPASSTDSDMERLRHSGLTRRLRLEDRHAVIEKLIRERRMAHVRQFQEKQAAMKETETLRKHCEVLVQSLARRVEGSARSAEGDVKGDGATLDRDNGTGTTGSPLQLQLALWALQREVAGHRASKSAMAEEAERLKRECKKRRELRAELAEKWRVVQLFDQKKTKLQQIAHRLNRSIQAISSSWDGRLWQAQEYCMSRVVPAGTSLRTALSQARGFVRGEVEAMEGVPRGLLLPMECEQVSGGKERTGGSVLRTGAVSREILAGSNRAPTDLLRLAQALKFCHLPTRSAASILPNLAKEIQEEEHLKALKDRWENISAQSRATLVELKRRVESSSESVRTLENEMRGEWMHALKESIQLATNNLTKAAEVERELKEYWEQPGGYVVTWISVKDANGQEKNVTEWLSTVRNLASRLHPRDRHFSRTLSSAS